jgi:hypothetical protein
MWRDYDEYGGDYNDAYDLDTTSEEIVDVSASVPENAIFGLGRDMLRMILDLLVVPATPYIRLCNHWNCDGICIKCKNRLHEKYGDVGAQELIANDKAITALRKKKSAQYHKKSLTVLVWILCRIG